MHIFWAVASCIDLILGILFCHPGLDPGSLQLSLGDPESSSG